MATPLAQLVVELRADNAKLRADFNKSVAEAKSAAKRIEGEVKKVSKSFESSSKSILQLRRDMDTAFRGVIGSFVFREVAMFSRSIAKASFDIQLLNQRIKVFTGNSAGFAEAFDAAQKLGVSVNNVATGMGRIVAVGAEMGVTTAEARKMTVTFQQLALLSGSSIKESQAAFIQFTQALSANRLSGEELRSVREQAPLVAQAIAKYMGISVGEIKKVAEEGKITADVMRGAMEQAAADAAEKFAQLPLTLERQQAALENSWTLMLAALDKILKQSTMWKFFNETLTKAFTNISARVLDPGLLPDDVIQSEIRRLETLRAQIELLTKDGGGGFGLRGQLPGIDADLALLRSEGRKRSFQAIIDEANAPALKAKQDAEKAAKEELEAIEKKKKLMKELGDLYVTEFDNVKAAVDFQGSLLSKITSVLNSNAAIQRQIRNDTARYDDSNIFGMAGGEPILGKDDPTLKADIQKGYDPYGISVKTAEIKDEVTEMTIMAEEAARSIQNSFADFLFDPFKEGLRGMLKGFIDTIRRMVAEVASAMILKQLFGFLGNSIGGGVGSFFASMAKGIGTRAYGGSVSSNQAYLVGERGPELLTGVNGKIVPGTDVRGGGGMTIAPTYNIDARGATQELASALPSILAQNNRELIRVFTQAMSRSGMPQPVL